jgi:hypothetical protein
MATKRNSARNARHAGSASAMKPLKGKASRGKEWIPSAVLALSDAPGPQEMNAPRPSSERYPIPNAAFQQLKEKSSRSQLPKKAATISKDSTRAKEEVSLMAEYPSAVADTPSGPGNALAAFKNFAGISATGWIPPDCTMAVGPTNVLISVNSSVQVHDKYTGTVLLQRTLTQWFANLVPNFTIFDPKTLYDQHAGRWVLLAVAFRQNPNRSVYLLSVSAGPDPLGAWRNYQFDAMLDGATPTDNWADFPSLGVDNQAFYLTSNMFAFGGNFQYAKIRVVPKAGPYSGGTAPFTDFVKMKNADGSLCFTIQPCHTFGAPQLEYLVNTAFPSGNYVTLWSIANPTLSPTLTSVNVPVSPYNLAPNADQQGGATPLNTGDVRILHAVFRGDSVWAAFTTAHNWGGPANRAAVQWIQLRAADRALVQQGIFGAAAQHCFYPAPCPDNNGNMVLVFSRCGPTEFGSLYYTGRKSTDPLGTLQPSALLKAGVANYVALDGSGRNRWGDYNGIAADPAIPKLIWLHGLFAAPGSKWGTWVGSSFF